MPGEVKAIKVTYSSIDGVRKNRRFQTVDGALRFARKCVGPHPTLGSDYAVSDDGVGKITVSGLSLAQLFREA
jgi:hypothetical protein